MPPPGPGLVTVIVAVDCLAMSEVGTVVLSSELLMKVVASAVAFQLITDPDTKPVPWTVSVKLGPPGAVAVGTVG